MPTRKSGYVIAREAIVINVDARPPVYPTITVTDNKSGEAVQIPADEPSDPGDEGMPYAFKAYQRVPKDHPAVKANPGAFMPPEDVDEELQVVEA